MRLVFSTWLVLMLKCSYAQVDTLIFYPVNNNKLQQSDIRSITIDESGKLWLSTGRGILSFDGNNVKAFAIDYGFFKSFRNKQENLYAIQNTGIYHFNTKTGSYLYLNTIIKSEDYPSDPRTFTDILPDNESFWCGRTNGFFHFNMLTKKTTFYPLYAHSDNKPIAIKNIIGDLKETNILWLATDDGIYMFDKKLQKLYRNFSCSNYKDSTFSDVQISKICTDATGNIWFAGKRGIGFYDIKKGLYTIHPNGKKEIDVKFLQLKNANEFYIGTSESCPGIFNIQTHQYIFNSKLYKQFPALNINDFVADNKGNLWCIILGQLYYASTNKNKFHTIPLQAFENINQAKKIFKTIIWDDKRKCYFSAFDKSNMIFVLDSSMKVIKSIPIKIPENKIQPAETNIYDISLDNNRRLWACGTALIVYDSITQTMVPADKLYNKLLFREQRFQNVILRNNYLYLQPSNPIYKAIYRIDLATFTYDSIPIPYNIIPAGYENSWNGRKYQEVAVIDKKAEYAYVGIGNYVLQVNLLTKKGKKITRVTLRDNGYYFNMFWYALDDDNNLWVSSGDGIKVINPRNLKVVKRIGHDDVTQRFQLSNAEGLGIVCLLYSGGVALYDYRNNKEYNLSLSDGLMTLFNSGIACVNNNLFVGSELNALQYLALPSITQKNVERKCYLSNIELFNQSYTTDTLPEFMHFLSLAYNQNFVTLTFSSTEFEQSEKLEYRYKLDGVNNDWVYVNYLNRAASYTNLPPGNYVFHASVKNDNGIWSNDAINLPLIILPAWWQTILFKIACALLIIAIIYFFIKWRITTVRRQEQVKVKYEKELLELEAQALRAQMNPHFIFNCMNSIKSLIQKNEQEKAITYLTTFSKLIRIIFQNSDKREISLYDELATCRLYTELESMRFGNKLSCSFQVKENLDLKSIKVPALIIQPFVENAIWHGIMPKSEEGKLIVSVIEMNNTICCTIDDNGIGREISKQNKFSITDASHESKGEHLTQARLDLDNLLNDHNTTIEIIDKKDDTGNASGTIIKICFKDY